MRPSPSWAPGGVAGQVAVQAARLGGAARVIALARSESSLETARALGADAVVALSGGDPGAALRDAAGGGVDLMVDTLWGAPLASCLAALGRGGRVVQVGQRRGAVVGDRRRPAPGRPHRHPRLLGVQRGPGRPRRRLHRAGPGGRRRRGSGSRWRGVPLDAAPDAWRRQAAGTGGVKLVLVP